MKESKIQSECFRWYNNNYCLKFHEPRGLMFSIPNEIVNVLSGILKSAGIPRGKINTIVMKIITNFKAMGLTSGVSDTIVILPNSKIIFVEFKTETGRQNKTQKEFESRVKSHQYDYHVVRSLEQFINLIQHYEK